MKRDEKNLISRNKILASAFREFGERGYAASSVNTICTDGGISKGILYHYFKNRDELYLACVQEMFNDLTDNLSQKLKDESGTPEQRMERYFDARLSFFNENPMYHKLFCDVAIAPPKFLATEIAAIREGFDELNVLVLTQLLGKAKLRKDITIEAAVETFRLYQDFINARFRMEPIGEINIEQHEQMCKRSISILLHGVMESEAE